MSNDTTICLGGSATVLGSVTSGSYGSNSYTFQTFPYSPEPFTGGNPVCADFNNCTSLGGGKDDCVAGPYNIGFDFCFFNQTYTQFWIGSNGWISFSTPPGNSWDTFTAVAIPNSGVNVPKNAVFFPWLDWLPCKGTTQDVYYYNSGTPPDMKLVVYWSNTMFYSGCPLTHATFQAVLNQQSSIIENNIESVPLCGSYKSTQGVQNETGTVAFTAPGRNNQQWSASNESTRFVPSGITWYTGGFPGGTIAGYGSPITFTPTVTTTYTAAVTLCNGDTAVGNVTVTVVSAQFSYPQYTYCQTDPNPTPAPLIPGGTFTATPAGLVFANPSSGTINLSASAPGTYTVNYAINTPCFVSYDKTIIINASPAAPTALASYVSRCGPGQVTFGVVQIPGQTIHWYDAPTGGNLLPLSGATVTATVNTTTNYYAEAVSGGTNCISTGRTHILVMIKAVPIITNTGLDFTLCSGDSLKITLVSSVAGSVYSWTTFSKSPTLSGYYDGTGPLISQKLINSGGVDDTVTYSVVAVKDTCSSSTVIFTAIVRPMFDISSSPAIQTICSDNAILISLTSDNPATTFGWIANGNSSGLSGFSGGTGNHISQTLTNSGPTDGLVTYKCFVTGTGCKGDTAISNVLVHPLPVPSITGPAAVCESSTGNVYTTQAGMNNYLWTLSPSGIITSGGTSTSNTATVTWTLSGSQSVAVNYSDLNGCNAGSPTFYPVVVNPLPGAAGNITGSSAVCQSTTGVPYSVSTIANAISYLWNLVPINSGTVNGNSAAVTIDWIAGFSGMTTLSVRGLNACGPGILSPSFSIMVNPKPYVAYNLCTDSITTFTAKPIWLKGGIPPGGSYSGSGVNSALGSFTPSMAGPGTHLITYTYNNVNSCVNSASQYITVVNPGTFLCGSSIKDVRDNKFYNTVQIGSQCWMAANLDYGTRILLSQDQNDNCVPEKYCIDDLAINCTNFGGLYQWDELMNYSSTTEAKGLCPPGWHVPSESDWNALFGYYINNGFAGAELKAGGFSGFDAIISGAGTLNRQFSFLNFAEIFWSSDPHGASRAWSHGMNSINPSVSYYPGIRSNGFHVRCLHD